MNGDMETAAQDQGRVFLKIKRVFKKKKQQKKSKLF